MREHEVVRRLVDEVRPTHLLHLAWETAHRTYYSTPDNLRWLVDSLNLIDAFIRSGGRRVVCAGSAAEYDLTTSADLNEATTPLRPNGLYGICKKALWEVVERYAADASVGHGWGRIFFCYGPGEDASRMVPTVVRALLSGERVPFQAGRAVRDYVHVDDVADGFVALTDSDVNGAVNLGSGRPITLRDFIEGLAIEAGRPGAVEFGALPTPSYEPARVVADLTRVRGALGWEPRRSLEEGIRDTVAWWRNALSPAGVAPDRATPSA
jgi:nucleoside-diphosphate-sugar epimerase